MDEAKLQEIEARATAIHAEMTHTRARCDDCGAVNPRLDDCGLHDGCPAGDWPRPPMRDWTKHEGTEGLCEIARHMTDLVAEVRRLTDALAAHACPTDACCTTTHHPGCACHEARHASALEMERAPTKAKRTGKGRAKR